MRAAVAPFHTHFTRIQNFTSIGMQNRDRNVYTTVGEGSFLGKLQIEVPPSAAGMHAGSSQRQLMAAARTPSFASRAGCQSPPAKRPLGSDEGVSAFRVEEASR